MGCPPFIDFEYSLPDPEGSKISFGCNYISNFQPYLFIIDKEGNLNGGSSYYLEDGTFCWGMAYHIDEKGKFDLTGEMGFYSDSRRDDLFFYVGHFVNGKLQSIRRPNLIQFESSSLSPEPKTRYFYTDQLGSNNGTIYWISEDGRLYAHEITNGSGQHFHGELTFITAMHNYAEANKYSANFENGKLISTKKLEVIFDVDELSRKYYQITKG